MRVRDVMDAHPVVVSALARREALLDTLRQARSPAVPVVKETERRLVGVASIHRLLDPDPPQRVSLLMDPNPPATYPEASVEEAAPLFPRFDAAILPVVNGNNDLLGAVWPHDVLPHLHPPRARAAVHHPRRLAPVHRATPISVALAVLRATRAPALPVLGDDGRLDGLAEPLALLDGDGKPREGRIADIMDPNPDTYGPETLVADAAARLASRPAAHLLFVDADGRVRDLMTVADVIARALEKPARPAASDRRRIRRAA